MHPFGLYLVITDRQREHGWVAVDKQRASFAPLDALPILEAEPVSLIRRLAAITRRRVMRTARA